MLKVGDMVHVTIKPYHSRWPRDPSDREARGTVVDIDEVTDLFSEKYAILETNTYLHVLCDGEVKVFDLEEWTAEVINESG